MSAERAVCPACDKQTSEERPDYCETCQSIIPSAPPSSPARGGGECGVAPDRESGEAVLESTRDTSLSFALWDGAVVGRGSRPDIDLWRALEGDRDFDRVSRRHARFYLRGGRWYIALEPGPKNETRVNGETIGPEDEIELSDGSAVQLAHVEFSFRLRARD